MKDIIITIPAFNEQKTLPGVIKAIIAVMQKSTYAKRYQILVVDDGSADDTIQVAKKAGAIVVGKKHRGLAQTFRSEMEECLKRKAKIIVHTDADGQYNPAHIPELIAKVEQGYDLVLGSRFLINRKHRMPLLKKLGNIAFAKVIGSLLGQKITDTTTGFRGFNAAIASEISYINTFTYTQEQIIKAVKQGFKVTEIPITIKKTRESRLFNSPIQYALRAWINILRIYRDYQPLSFFGRIGIGFFSVGFVIGLWLLYRFVTLGYVGRVPSQILSVLLMLVGMQIVLFGFLADMSKQ